MLLNPSANRIISAIMAESGTTIEIGLNMLFKLSGNSVRPAYPAKEKSNFNSLLLTTVANFWVALSLYIIARVGTKPFI